MENDREIIISARVHGAVNPIVEAMRRGMVRDMIAPSRILKSGNRTIVFWADGTKTIVKRADDEAESDYAAYTAALGIKLYGSNSALKRIVERTETQKPKKRKVEASEKQKEEHGKWLFDRMMKSSGMKWICPRCKSENAYEMSTNGVIAVCRNCGAYAEVKTGNEQKEDD